MPRPENESCGSCKPHGVLWPVNGLEVQRCDECAPDWSDEDAANALRAAFPWIPIVFDPDRDEETDTIPDPEIGVYVIDLDNLTIPADAPTWIVERLNAMLDDTDEDDPELCPVCGSASPWRCGCLDPETGEPWPEKDP